MSKNHGTFLLLLITPPLVGVTSPPAQGSRPRTSVAHRGASAYAPEHTLAAYRLALEQKADYVEQDLALTKDGVLVCLHDDSLERTTNVEDLFPDRVTVDPKTGGRHWLAADFTLAEIKRLDAGGWFASRFAGERVPTWQEAVDAVRGRAGLYPELKSPARYRERGLDSVAAFAAAVKAQGLDRRSTAARPPLIVQSFDPDAIRALARALPDVPRLLLVGVGAERWLTAEGLREAASLATGIGPAKALIDGRAEVVRQAHEAGLTVTPYTFRSADTGRFPDVRAEMRYFLFDLGVDALFTDNPDLFPRS